MSTKSFTALMARLAATPEGQAEHVAVAFLAQVNARMQVQGISNVELARRIGTSPAYITRLFRGSANLSVQTMTKLAHAVNSTLSLELVAYDRPEPPVADAGTVQ
jgi:transcriptional regulator with XRE-family HTH domain